MLQKKINFSFLPRSKLRGISLIQAGADVNATDNQGNTALELAKEIQVAEHILNRDSEIKIKNRIIQLLENQIALTVAT